jgi:tryptophanyl-tRNA synthetase
MGNYFGMMKPAIELQEQGEAYYFIADLHALTSVHDSSALRANVRELAVDFLACGLDPARAVFFRQSDVPAVTELSWILSTVTPMGLLERCHSFKDKTARGLGASHGLFAYPVLMAADILICDSDLVPVGKDQKQHLEVTRDIAVKMNETYGEIFKLPQPSIRDETAVVPGLDGAKMSKSYHNTIAMREDKASIETKVKRMPTDPARVKRSDPGNPDRCPVWQFHLVYSPPATRDWVKTECARAGIGCLECKQPVIDAIVSEQQPMLARAEPFVSNPRLVRDIVDAGTQRARATAQETMRDVREAMGLNY